MNTQVKISTCNESLDEKTLEKKQKKNFRSSINIFQRTFPASLDFVIKKNGRFLFGPGSDFCPWPLGVGRQMVHILFGFWYPQFWSGVSTTLEQSLLLLLWFLYLLFVLLLL